MLVVQPHMCGAAAAAGERGTLLDVWCQMQLLLSGAALLPHPDQVR